MHSSVLNFGFEKAHRRLMPTRSNSQASGSTAYSSSSTLAPTDERALGSKPLQLKTPWVIKAVTQLARLIKRSKDDTQSDQETCQFLFESCMESFGDGETRPVVLAINQEKVASILEKLKAMDERCEKATRPETPLPEAQPSIRLVSRPTHDPQHHLPQPSHPRLDAPESTTDFHDTCKSESGASLQEYDDPFYLEAFLGHFPEPPTQDAKDNAPREPADASLHRQPSYISRSITRAYLKMQSVRVDGRFVRTTMRSLKVPAGAQQVEMWTS